MPLRAPVDPPQSPAVLLLCALIIDAIGYASFVLPVIGEAADLYWAPLSAALIYWLFGSVQGAALGFVEEALPFTDFIPTALLVWARRFVLPILLQ